MHAAQKNSQLTRRIFPPSVDANWLYDAWVSYQHFTGSIRLDYAAAKVPRKLQRFAQIETRIEMHIPPPIRALAQ